MSNLMELLSWDLLKSLIEILTKLRTSSDLSESYLTALPINNVFLTGYVIALMFTQKASVAKASLAFVCSAFAGYLWMDVLAGWQYYLILTIIYGLTVVSLRQIKVMVSCCIMMSFTIYMIFDEARYGADDTWIHVKTIKTWAWVHYELVTCFIHCLIISASINWRSQLLRKGMEWLARFVRGIGHSLGCYPRL